MVQDLQRTSHELRVVVPSLVSVRRRSTKHAGRQKRVLHDAWTAGSPHWTRPRRVKHVSPLTGFQAIQWLLTFVQREAEKWTWTKAELDKSCCI